MNKELEYTVNENKCWIYAGAKDRHGYGIIKHAGKTVRAHRYNFELHKGAILPGMVIRHTCNNPSCINPKHLLQGTQKQNMQDKAESKKIFCTSKHELNHSNSYIFNNRRICRICRTINEV